MNKSAVVIIVVLVIVVGIAALIFSLCASSH